MGITSSQHFCTWGEKYLDPIQEFWAAQHSILYDVALHHLRHLLFILSVPLLGAINTILVVLFTSGNYQRKISGTNHRHHI